MMEREQTERRGKIWLAGAGPGDASLLTVKTRQLLDAADVVVYDALISAEILSQIPREKKLINVGKRSGNHPVPQPEINEILVEEAKKGKKVLRLKGGDPFVFGRGGEEIERLLQEGIPFEVVPAVTSACAVPAYAGIPITHRDYTSSFHVITGHARKGETADIPYKELVKINGTLVFLMGMTALPSICKGLLEAGMAADMPAAVLERGTTAKQRRVVSTLAGLPEAAKKACVRTPAVIIVGKVCALEKEFHWAEDRPLGGRQILLTRPKQNISKLAGNLRKLGAQVIELPSIETRPIEPNPVLNGALERFGKRAKEEWLVFTSPIGVQVLFEQLKEMKKDMRDLIGIPMKNGVEIKIAAIGKSTAAELENHSLSADLIPDVYCAAQLGRELAKAAAADSAVTIVRAAKGSKELIPPLEKVGIMVEDIPLYVTEYQIHEELHEKLAGMFADREIDAVTFTSASTVQGFVKAVHGVEFENITAVCIGEQTAREAEKYGMDIVVSERASMDSMTEKIVELFAAV